MTIFLEPCQFITEETPVFTQLCGQPIAHLIHIQGRPSLPACCLHTAAMLYLMKTLGLFFHEDTLPHNHLL